MLQVIEKFTIASLAMFCGLSYGLVMDENENPDLTRLLTRSNIFGMWAYNPSIYETKHHSGPTYQHDLMDMRWRMSRENGSLKSYLNVKTWDQYDYDIFEGCGQCVGSDYHNRYEN